MLFADGRFGRGFNSRRLHHLFPFLLLSAAAWFVLRGESVVAPRAVDLAGVPLRTLAGASLSPEQLRGHAVVLNVWATWCPACRLEMADLDRLQQEVPQVRVVGMDDASDAPGAGLAYAQAHRLGITMIAPSPALEHALGRSLDLPTTLFLSPSGKVVHAVTGTTSLPLMRRYTLDAANTP